MIRLATPDQTPHLVDLGRGVSMTLRAITSLEMSIVRRDVSELIEGFVTSSELLSSFGLAHLAKSDIDDDLIFGLSQRLLVVLCCERAGTGWTGVGDASGTRAPFTRKYISQLCEDTYFQSAIEQHIYARLYLEITEEKS